MSQHRNNHQAGTLLVVAIAIAALVFVRFFSDLLGLPMAVGTDVLVRGTLALVAAVVIGWFLIEMHQDWLLIALCVFAAGLSVALWPALDVWAVADPAYAFLDVPGMEQELQFWGGGWARAVYCLAPLAGAAGLFVQRQHY